MTISDLIKKGKLIKAVTAIHATTATHIPENDPSVAPVATVAVAKLPEHSLGILRANPMTEQEEALIRGWLTYIGETAQETITEVLNKARIDSVTRRYFLERANEIQYPVNNRKFTTKNEVNYV